MKQRITAALIFVAVVILGVVLLRPTSQLPDFRAFEAGPERKAEFFEYLTPIVQAANAKLAAERARLLDIAGSETLGRSEKRWLKRIATRYELDYDAESPREVIAPLKRRIDTVPLSLALAQAAKESGWGTSRFAREGNNLFGEWCFSPGCGIVPSQRAAGRTHEVRSFDSPQESIDSYMMTLNTHPAYRELRGVREQLRAEGARLSGLRLAAGLSRYSERGAAYVQEIRNLIRFNDLE